MLEVANPVLFRENVRIQLGRQFGGLLNTMYPTWTNELEEGIFEWTMKESGQRQVVQEWSDPYFVQLYRDKLFSLWSNLRKEATLRMILRDQIQPRTFAFMTHQEMDPVKWADAIRAKSIRDKNRFERTDVAMTDTFTCRQCRSKNCSYYQMQTRAADEPMTVFVECMDCGKRWKC